MNATLTATVPTNDNTRVETISFGNGRYSPEMFRIFGELQSVFGVEPKKAEKIARQVGSDFGELMKNQSASIKVGSMNKDGKATIGESVEKLKGVTLTNPLSLVRALQWVNDAGKNGVSYGFTKWELIPVLKTYVAELEVKG